MKNKKVLNFLVFALMIFISQIFSVKADTPPSSITINTNDEYYQTTLWGSQILPTGQSTLHTIQKKTTDGNIVYCAEEDANMPAKGSGEYTWDYSKAADNSDELGFIFENGYRGQSNYSATKYLTGNPQTDYFITGMAVWGYTRPAESLTHFEKDSSGKYIGTYRGEKNEASEKIANLINDASGYKKNPSITINVSNTKLTLTSDKKYYISSPITFGVKDLTSNVTVSVSGGAFVTSDKNATSGTTSFAQGSTVYVKVPVEKMTTSTSITLKVSATGKKFSAYIYSHNNSNYQLMARFVEEPLSSESTKAFTMDKIAITISKQDVTGSKEVEGATLVIKKGNTVVDKWVSGSTAKKISLDTGTYTLEETIAPAGYKLSSSKVTFTVNSNGTVTVDGKVVDKVIMKNEPFYITISKLGLTKDKELVGAKLKITDKDGKLTKDLDGKSLEWMTTENAEKFHLADGTYYLTELEAPAGYIKTDKTIEFVVEKDGTIKIDNKEVSKVTMENEPLYIYISKKSINGKTELPGAKLKITDKDGKLEKDLDGKSLIWTSSTKEERFRLAPGSYILTELEAPKGYELSDAVIEFTVTEDGRILFDKKEAENNMIVFKNTPEPEQVVTGSSLIYILFVGIITAGVVTFFVLKRND